MTNDYKKGHKYRMRTDADYRKRRNLKRPKEPSDRRCQKCGKKTDHLEYHHFNGNEKGRGVFLCRSCHSKAHGGRRRGPEPYSTDPKRSRASRKGWGTRRKKYGPRGRRSSR